MAEGDTLLTPNEVVKKLVGYSRDLDAAVRLLKTAELDAAKKRHDANMKESKAFLNAEGSMDIRKHEARVAADKEEGEALVAEAVVRHLRVSIRAIENQIEIGRSYGAAVRAELKTLGYGEN